MRAWIALGWLVFTAALAPAAAADVSARVVAVSDGDSFTAEVDGETLKCRLWGVDAPETGAGYHGPGQPFSTKARAAMRRLILGKRCTLEVVARDHNGRSVVRVFVGEPRIDAGAELLRAGLAWHDVRFAPHAADYAAAEVAARAARMGLWRGKAPLAPWEWRARQRPGRR